MRREIVRFRKKMYDKGLIGELGGNLSVREGEIIYITPSSVPVSRFSEDEVAEVKITGEILRGSPSIEYRMHLEIYRRTDFRAVVHTHSIYATAISCLERVLYPRDIEGEVYLGDEIPVLPYREPGSQELAETVAREIEKKRCRAVLLEDHGAVTVGNSLEEAYICAEILERVAKVAYLCALYES
ncbi:MAG: L-fuculose-phosphate aldolase [Archaeoglobi archaeon]|nr:L-fuculose-phosphate aldolase [Archaeoglobi archaeon]MDK2781866.1 L-fuculose-phosphate aldolase [Archaeoglobi archaeon]